MLISVDQQAHNHDGTLKPWAVPFEGGKGREHEEPADAERMALVRDKQRIIHSKLFKRLGGKTQVVTAGTADHVRNRLFHSLEVAGLAESMALTLGANPYLAWCIGALHDVGHTPFAHAGEDALKECMQRHEKEFEHNEQSLRTVTELESPYPGIKGLNLTREVLEGLQKHSSPYDQVGKRFVSASVEAQLVDEADSIAYYSGDLDDGIRLGILKEEDFTKLKIWKKCAGEGIDPVKDRAQVIKSMINLMVTSILEQTDANIERLGIETLEDVYNCKERIVDHKTEVAEMIEQLDQYLFQNFYYSETVRDQAKRGQGIITDLFNLFVENPTILEAQLDRKIADDEDIVIITKDYVAGMTDHFATDLHSKLCAAQPA